MNNDEVIDLTPTSVEINDVPPPTLTRKYVKLVFKPERENITAAELAIILEMVGIEFSTEDFTKLSSTMRRHVEIREIVEPDAQPTGFAPILDNNTTNK